MNKYQCFQIRYERNIITNLACVPSCLACTYDLRALRIPMIIKLDRAVVLDRGATTPKTM